MHDLLDNPAAPIFTLLEVQLDSPAFWCCACNIETIMQLIFVTVTCFGSLHVRRSCLGDQNVVVFPVFSSVEDRSRSIWSSRKTFRFVFMLNWSPSKHGGCLHCIGGQTRIYLWAQLTNHACKWQQINQMIHLHGQLHNLYDFLFRTKLPISQENHDNKWSFLLKFGAGGEMSDWVKWQNKAAVGVAMVGTHKWL